MYSALSTYGTENYLTLLALLTKQCMVGRIRWSVFGFLLNYYLQTPHASTVYEAELTPSTFC